MLDIDLNLFLLFLIAILIIMFGILFYWDFTRRLKQVQNFMAASMQSIFFETPQEFYETLDKKITEIARQRSSLEDRTRGIQSGTANESHVHNVAPTAAWDSATRETSPLEKTRPTYHSEQPWDSPVKKE